MKKIQPPQRAAPTRDVIRAALFTIPPDLDRATWVRVGMALKDELGDDGRDLWDEWSRQAENYSAADARAAWRGFHPGGGVTVGTLFGIAKDHGFKFPDAGQVQTPAPPTPEALEAERQRSEERERKRQAEAEDYRRRADKAEREARELWESASQEGDSPYLVRKGVSAHGVRFLPDGTLLVPMRDAAGELRNVQRIAPSRPTPEEQAAGKAEKRFLPGGRKRELFHLLGPVQTPAPQVPPVLLLAEGYATGATLHEATGYPVAVAFDAGNLPHVAKALRQLFPAALLLVCGDDDRETEARTGRNPGREKAAEAARTACDGVAQAGTVFPAHLPEGATDFNDMATHAGLTAVRELVCAAAQSPEAPTRRRSKSAAKAAPAAQPAAAAGSGDEEGGTNESGQGGGVGRAARPGPQGAAEDEGGEAGAPTVEDPFTLTQDGVYFTARDAEGNRKRPVWLCAPLRVTARTRAEDANGWGYLLEFTDLDDNAKSWAMPAALLSKDGAEWAGRLCDMGLQMATGARPRNLLAQYINTRRLSERATCTDRVGWHPGGVFVLPSGCIGGASERRYVFQSEGGMEDTFRQRGELAAWAQHVAAPCQGNTRLVFGVCCALAGPLLRLAGMESGGFHFRGDSSKGKTTSLRIAASVWGPPTYMQRWRTTDNALEATAVQHCDGLLILDEIGQVDGRVLGDCAYLLANEQEKGRATRNGLTRKRRTWRLLFLSSGEKSMEAHMAEAGRRVMAGQEVRMVDIPLNAGAGMGGLEELHGHDSPGALAEAVVGAAARVYGTAGRAWLEWLAARFGTLPERVSSMVDAQRLAIVPEAASEQVRRVGARFALVAVAGELAREAGIVPWTAGEATAAARACFNAWLGARGHLDNGEAAAMLRQARAFLETNGDALFTWAHRAMDDHRGNTPLRAGFKRMVDAEGNPVADDSKADYLDRIGGNRERAEALVEYLVFPQAFKRDVAKGFDAAAVAELLRQRGHLKCEKGRLTIRQRLPGMEKAPVYHVLPSIFQDELL